MRTWSIQVLDEARNLAAVGLFLCALLPAGRLAASPPPVITVQPLSQTVLIGDSVTFDVKATSGTKLSYQWRKEGVSIAGATDSAYTIAAVSLADAGDYSVKVINAGGYVISSNATLTVLAPPEITAQPQSQTVLRDGDVTFCVTAVGTAPLSYQWNHNDVPIAGATNSTLTIHNVKNSHAGNYTVVVANPLGSVASDVARLTVVAPVAITQQPQSQIVVQGLDATFSVGTVGTPPLFYQWCFDGTWLAGATNSVLTVNNAQTTDAGHYTVVVANPWSSVTSAVATLTVIVPPDITTELESQSARVGQDVTLSVIATGTDPLGYTWMLNGTLLTGANSPELILNNVQTTDAGRYTVIVTNSAGAAMSTAMLTVTNPAAIIPLHLYSAAMTPAGFKFQFQAPIGQTYIVQATMNLRNWIPIATNTVLAGTVEFTDATAASRPLCHYRVLLVNSTVVPSGF